MSHRLFYSVHLLALVLLWPGTALSQPFLPESPTQIKLKEAERRAKEAELRATEAERREREAKEQLRIERGLKESSSAKPQARSVPPIPKDDESSIFAFFIQAGAFDNRGDAEQLQARLRQAGFESLITEREQMGRVVFRVRLGPYGTQAGVAPDQERLKKAEFDAVIVRVQK